MKSIGNTPLLKLEKLTDEDSATVYVKFEGANPTGSMKDRMALAMIEGAEKRGELKKGGTVTDYTGGSTGSSLAMICSAKGYKAHFVSSDAFAAEKLQTMRAFGATLELVPSENGKITAQVIDTALHSDLESVPGCVGELQKRVSQSFEIRGPSLSEKFNKKYSSKQCPLGGGNFS